MDTLILFDIDGTLIKGSSVHKDSFSHAFNEVYGVNGTIDNIDYHGMTDQQIIFRSLDLHKVPYSTIQTSIEYCMDEMVSYFVNHCGDETIRPLPGVSDLLDRFKARGFGIGLVTGNLKDIAYGKLRNAGLDAYFVLGGFGSDDLDRSRLVNLAIRKGFFEKGLSSESSVYLFGDTPSDMHAALSAGVTPIGVATGNYSEEDLLREGAHRTVQDLTETNYLEMLVANQ